MSPREKSACSIRSPTAATNCSFCTNADGAIDFKIVTAPLTSPERANWRDLIPIAQGVYIMDIDLFAGHLVRLERANALPAIIIRDLATAEEHAIAFDEAAYSLDTIGGYEFDTTNLALLLFVDDDAVGSLRLRHGEPDAHLAQASGNPVRPRPGRLRHHPHHGEIA